MPRSDADLDALAGLFRLAGRLKTLKRQGWIDRGVDQPESVADHSWRLALMAATIAGSDPGVDASRAVLLALVHDLPEAVTGDVTPFDDQLSSDDADRSNLFHSLPEYSQTAEQSKTQAEREALRAMTKDLPEEIATMLVEAWEEYESGATAEAQFVRQLDKLETWLQALEYQQIQPELIIESFRKGTKRDIQDPELVRLLDCLASRSQSG